MVRISFLTETGIVSVRADTHPMLVTHVLPLHLFSMVLEIEVMRVVCGWVTGSSVSNPHDEVVVVEEDWEVSDYGLNVSLI